MSSSSAAETTNLSGDPRVTTFAVRVNIGIPLGQAIGSPKDKVFMLVEHDDRLRSVGDLLHANWQLPTFAWNDTPTGGAMVF